MFNLKVIVMVVLIYRLYQYWVGNFSGAILRKLLIDITYLGIGLYIVLRSDTFSEESIYLDIPFAMVVFLFMMEIVLVLKLYLEFKNFEINSEKRLIYFIEYYLSKNKKQKAFKILNSHGEIVGYSSKLLIHLGDIHQEKSNFKVAYECFVEATEFTKDEDLLLLASSKAYQVCTKELNDTLTAKAFIQSQLVKDLSPRFINELENIMHAKSG